MQLSSDQIFAIKQQLQTDMERYETQLQELVQRQATIKKIETLAAAILEYDQLEKEISDRSLLFELFSTPPEELLSPFVKSRLFRYLEAAETVSVELVNILANEMLLELRAAIATGDDDSVDLIQAEYKEYIIPGKIIAERWEEIDGLLDEMNRFCQSIQSDYDASVAHQVLCYAFQVAIDADTAMEPTIDALKTHPFQWLNELERSQLLDHTAEHIAVLRFEVAKKQEVAMAQAVHTLAKDEDSV